MATKKSVSKISDKLSKVSDSFTICMYDNGFLLEISGRRSDNDDWGTAKIMVPTIAELTALITEASEMEKD